jgi:hypothetical protein
MPETLLIYLCPIYVGSHVSVSTLRPPTIRPLMSTTQRCNLGTQKLSVHVTVRLMSGRSVVVRPLSIVEL